MNSRAVANHDWVVVGGGPQGVHVAVRLLADGGVAPARLRLVDPWPDLLHRWRQCTTNTGMRFLRSPAVHHLDVPPFALLQHVGRRKRDRLHRGLFTTRYKRPALGLFNGHSQSVVEKYGLDGLHVRDRVEHAALQGDGVDLRLGSGRTLRAARVVLALGNSEHPHWPERAARLRDEGGDVRHVFSADARVAPDSLRDEVAILGGGISAAQLAVRLADAGRRVTVVARHPPREEAFDSDPGWLGLKYMSIFAATPGYGERRALIQAARHRGSMPSDVRLALLTAIESGSVRWRIGSLQGGSVLEDGSMLLALDDEAETTWVGTLFLATGFSSRRPGGSLVDTLIEEHDLPVGACGFPVVDAELRWHPRLFVTGPLAELELGPTARNLTGGRRAADRIIEVARAAADAPGRPRQS